MASRTEVKINALGALRDRIWKRFPKGGSGGSQALSAVGNEISRLDDAARALRALHQARNPTETDGTHIKRVAAAAQKYGAEVQAARERVRKVVADGLVALDARIRQQTSLAPDAYAAEVRAMFRRLSQTERVKLLGELIEEKRGAEFAAIVKAPRTVTGLPEQMRQQYETAYVSKHAAAELLDQGALREVLEIAEVAANEAADVASAYANPATLAEIAKAEAAAAAAAKSFDAAVGKAA